jgi:uncharacterized membrane protein YkvA (DUF1232 family)
MQNLPPNIYAWIGPLFAFLYCISPIDLIPDMIPVLGWLDDALVVSLTFCSLARVLWQQRRQARREQQQPPPYAQQAPHAHSQ